MIEITITGGMVWVLLFIGIIYAIDTALSIVLYFQKKKLAKTEKRIKR